MLRPPRGVGGPRHEPAVGEELFGGGEDAEGVDLADAWDPEHALHVGIGNEIVVKRGFEPMQLAALSFSKEGHCSYALD